MKIFCHSGCVSTRHEPLLTAQDIRAATDLPDADLQRSLQSLACGKYRVLTKHPKGRDVNATDQFTFNDAFVCPLARIKIAQVVSKVETPKERNETQEMVDEERKHQVEVLVHYDAATDSTRLVSFES